MNRPLRKVAVLGSGVMGSAIAAHFANAGIPSLVLDVVPREPTAAEAAAGLTIASRAVRDRIARDSVRAMLRARPSPLFVPERLALIETGNLEDDLQRLAEADWVIEAVKEDMGIKKAVLAAAAPHLARGAVLSSNTSGLSLAEMASVLPPDLLPGFLGTHFFNPARYMKLLEIVPTARTDRGTLDRVAEFSRLRLGKGIVEAKDTQNFIANRIGTHALVVTFGVMREMGLTIEEVDALTGPALCRPKTATFRLADLVGLDVLLHVADHVFAATPGDESRGLFEAPDYLRRLVAKGLLGRKSGGGFYRKEKGDGGKVSTLDLESLEYREPRRPDFPELRGLKSLEDPGARLAALVGGSGRGSAAAWRILGATLAYSARRLGEICDDASAVDRAMRWGFNWDLGPFEAWDVLGFRPVVERLRRDGETLPAWVNELYESGGTSIYSGPDERRLAPTARPGVRVPVAVEERALSLDVFRRAGREVRRNPGASLLDLGDGVLCLEFHSKMNAIGQDTISMMTAAAREAEANWQALVVANQGANFCAGANLMLLLMEARDGNWDAVDGIVRSFQAANSRLEQCAVPVVVAPHGLALGGGCEVVLAANAVRAAAETYIGLVEVGAGVIPAGGGCLRLYRRNVASQADPEDAYAGLKKTFETIGTARVSGSAEEARALGFLRPQDGWSMNGEYRIADAKAVALALARGGWEPPGPERAVPVLGRSGFALLESALANMADARFITEHDRKIGRELARVLSGGDIPGPTAVSERHVLDLEREGFLRLCGERKTQERIQALLETGKPLRN
jgi:3-hydroxyacyl-CoA dehydrogenase